MNRDIGIDLGTANTLVHVRSKGIVINEPSVVAINKETGQVIAVGDHAKEMLGRTPENIVAIRPLKDGVIADFDVTQAMLRYFIRKVHPSGGFIKPRVIVCVPSGVTPVERRAVEEATLQAGAREVYLIEEPMAASIGAQLPINEATGSMIVDIGGGTSEVAVISLGGVVNCRSIRIAGDEFDRAIINYIKKEFNMLIGERTAELIKITIGSAYKMELEESMEVRGRDLVTGLPKTAIITSEQVREALKDSVRKIIITIKTTLEETPPELSADIMEKGITLTGGGALLRGIQKLIEVETRMPVSVAASPLDCVVLGTGRVLDDIDVLKRVLINTKR